MTGPGAQRRDPSPEIARPSNPAQCAEKGRKQTVTIEARSPLAEHWLGDEFPLRLLPLALLVLARVVLRPLVPFCLLPLLAPVPLARAPTSTRRYCSTAYCVRW